MTDERFTSASGETRVPVAVIGLEEAGKSSFIRRIMGEEFLERTLPTAGLDTNFLQINGLLFQLFDLGGHKDFREFFWENYVKLSRGIIFIVDSNDIEKIGEAKEWFWKVIQWNPSASLLILANKADLPVYIDRQEFIQLLELKRLPIENSSRSFRIFEVSMKTGKNVDNALTWLCDNITKQTIGTSPKLFGIFFYLSNGLPITSIKIDPKLDGSLFTGYLSAMDNFTADSLGPEEGLRSIYTDNHRILIVKRKNLICSVVSDKGSETIMVRIIAESILGFMEDHFSSKIKLFEDTGKLTITKRGILYFLERNFPESFTDKLIE